MGRAELARIMLSAADKEFEDDRFEKEEWPERKPNTPCGQVPVLTHGDKQIPQSMAIARYLARDLDLYGKNNVENTKCDVVIECINDVITETVKLFFEQDETKKIRSTYGSISDYENEHIEYIFVLGQIQKPEIQQKINDESEKYRDIVQGNFVDSYRNLTYKRVFSLFWVNNFCSIAKFVVKVDDDVIINIPLLIQHLRQKTKKNLLTNVLECYMHIDTEPLRQNNSKWRTSLSEYQYPTFPPYCDGFSSIKSIDVIRKMYNTTKEVPFLWLEDVYGGVFLPWISNIEMHQACVERENWHCKLFVRSFCQTLCLKRYMGTDQTTTM
ncbi:B3GALT1 [Mytilus edulis]|uniref:Hexosyltransferase n=1 Tax=Mytilus edulis TaxID=6550 RepID=A0A8S3U7Q4_MYTED|nr:B3GALT1 [Mytilus edulis]